MFPKICLFAAGNQKWKRLFLCGLLVPMLLSGCVLGQSDSGRQQYTETFLTLFDTVTTVVGTAGSEEIFRQKAQEVYDALSEYHRLFDIYNEYDGMNNLKTVNDHAGEEPVRVAQPIIDLLLDCKAYYEETGGVVNIAMGSVLSLWHYARTESLKNPDNAFLPDSAALEAAAQHTDFSDVVIDAEAGTVFFADPMLKLDVGAVAKGWAAERVSSILPQGMFISVGGNVCTHGPKDAEGTPWVIGIQNPGGEGYLQTINFEKGGVATSGNYQRTYSVEGVSYHHIIDPATLFPAREWRSVTVVCSDAGTADVLSTALFLMTAEKGKELLKAYDGEAMWVAGDGRILYSDGFRELIRN